MLEVLLGYITGFSDMINDFISTIKDLINSILGKNDEPESEHSDEEVLLQNNIVNK